MAATSLPLIIIHKLQAAAALATREALTVARKFLHDIDDENLLNDQIMLGAGWMEGISLEWPGYNLYFTIDGDLTCHVNIWLKSYRSLSVDAATQLVTARLRTCVRKHDPDDEYRKDRR